jgi:hypothetical protein
MAAYGLAGASGRLPVEKNEAELAGIRGADSGPQKSNKKATSPKGRKGM